MLTRNDTPKNKREKTTNSGRTEDVKKYEYIKNIIT
jgi:hypothetical protein